MSSLTEHRSDSGAARPEQGLARELRASALLLGLSFGLTAVVVVSAQAAAALLGS